MPMHVALSSLRSSRSLPVASAASPFGLANAATGIGPVLRATEAAAARSSADSAIARSIELNLGRRREEPLYDRRGRMDAAAPALPSATDAVESGPAAGPYDADAKALAADAGAATEGVDETVDEAVDEAADEPAEEAAVAEDRAPGAAFAARGGTVQVEILASDSGYDNQIVVSFDGFKTYTTIGTDNQADGGPMAFEVPVGTPLDFGIVNGEGTLLRAGAAWLNPDGLEHARTQARDDGSLTIGFEDLTGGGDLDFNDAVIRVSQVRQTEQAADVEAAGVDLPVIDDADEVQIEADAAVDAEAEAAVAQSAEEAELLAASGMQTAQLVAMAERNRQLLAALYLHEPALPADPAVAADGVRPSDVDQPWR